MDNAKKARTMLNVSLILSGAYYLIFVVGYLCQKSLWFLFHPDSELIRNAKPHYSVAVIVTSVLILAGIVAFNLLLRKDTPSAGLCTGTVVFCCAAFTVDRLVKMIAPAVEAIAAARFGGEEELIVVSLGSKVMNLLGEPLLVLLAVSLALMPCACCVARREMNQAQKA